MLHQQDTKMIVMDEAAPNSLFELDIERGKIVEEWKVNDSIPVQHIAPENKFAQTTVEHTLVGASGNALFRIDPRLPGAKLVDSQYKQYVARNRFSGVATTAAGGIKGRFFNGKNASAAPVLFTILGIFGLGYTIDYQSASSVVISHTNELTLSEPLIVHLSTSYRARLSY